MAVMIAAERRQLRAVESQLVAMVSTRPTDFILTTRIRLSVIALMRTPDVAKAVNEELPALLRLATCTLLSEAPDRRGVGRLPHGAVARLLGRGRDAVVRATPSEVDLLHGPAATPRAIPAKQATAALAFLGRAVGAAMAR